MLGADVYVHWTMALVPLALLSLLAGERPALEALAWTGLWTAAAAAVVWTHAMAHLWASGALVTGTGIVLLAPFGPLAHGAPPALSPATEVRTALAGPASHALWVLATYLLSFFVYRPNPFADMLDVFLQANAVLAGANLLPFHPMDGGRALRGLLTPRLGAARAEAWTASAGYGGGVTLGLAGLTILLGGHDTHAIWAVVLVALGTLTLTASQRALFAAQFQARRPLPPPREPERAPAVLDERALRRLVEQGELRTIEEPALETEAERKARLKARVDELLDRIIEVGGLERLSAAERAELREISESLRREPAEG